MFGLMYGRAKVGKTLALVRAFPDALFVAPKGALTCAKWLDWEPRVLELPRSKGFKSVTEAIKRAGNKFPAVVVDDLSLIADVELEQCKKTTQGFAAFDLFNKRMYDLRDAARDADCHVFFVCHEQAPREVKKDNHNRYIPGAPLIPGWQAPEKLPAMVDFCARVVYDDSASGWPYHYATGPDENYIQGDRLAVLPDLFPMNLREAMLGAGLDVPRPESLAWMDEYVEATAQDLLEESTEKKPDYRRVMTATTGALEHKSPHHVRWILADAMDRMVLRKHQQNMLADFIGNY